jgi:hypothetical protein
LSQAATVAEIAAPAMPLSLADRLDGRTRSAKLHATYRAALIKAAGGEPSDAQMILIDRGCELLLRADSLDRKAEHALYAYLIAAFVVVFLEISKPSRRNKGA